MPPGEGRKRDTSAFTVAEFAEIQKNVDEPEPWHADGSWWWYCREEGIESDTMADAYAERLIHFIENKLITLD